MFTLKQFTGLYQLSKTLRFELKPVGRTKEHIVSSGLLEQDEHRADSYIGMKRLLDEFHKYFIEKSLSDINLNLLENFYVYYIKKREGFVRESSRSAEKSNS